MTDKQLRQAEKRIADLELMVSLGEDRENELEQALSRANTQYEKVVEQNQSLQQENKQLKRKEQECEELKKEQSEIKKYLGISHKTILERLEELTDFRDKDREQLDQLKAENEEYKKLKEYLKISEITTLEDGDLIFTSKVFDKVVQNNNELKQALKDIENCLTVLDCPQLNENEDIHPIQAGSVCASVILDIINKAKDGE